ncbi:helix-turn-helix domain-containing protein [Lentzea flava]|uniref:Transcriptional regulator n=1 Tax=Lentzea flava TaxID=103732 RepID=A0ABQ2URS4_9PSEU|nr:helix-turn-helix transcriptional regulator [Lentzea flava]MCP2200908.1 Helix-turn-helix domain-containing protein [Lentzea flava]GGU47116.1 transcriptional regulator [Lentzea flava]
MDEQLAVMIGERVRLRCLASRMPKTVIAGLAGITPDYLYQIERGLKLPTVTVLKQLADVLGVSADELLHSSTKRKASARSDSAGDALYRAFTRPLGSDGAAVDVKVLRRNVLSAWQTWQTSATRYSQLAPELPELVIQTERALRGGAYVAAAERREVQRCAADLYALLRSVAKRLGRVDVSLLAADRAIRAGENADDPLRLAMAQWNLAQVLLADGEAQGAEDVAMHAAESLSPRTDDLDAVALRGALLLVGSIAAARCGDVWRARERVQAVEPLAQRTGERNTLWTVFGPTNVAMHAVSIEVEAGAAADGLRLAERIDHDRSPSIERRVAFLLDQAKGQVQRRDYGSALVMLSATEREAPEDLKHRPAAHRLLETLVQRARRSVATEAARLATRVGAPL